MSLIQLNISTLSNPYLLFVSLTSLLILGQDHLNKITFRALVDSRSTYCFVDSKFVDTHHLKTSTTPSVALHLFDGSSNSTISKIANLPIIFSTGDCMNLDFYVTPLDSSCSLVLGYNWLIRHNLLIDWINGLINFCPSLQENLAPSRIVLWQPLIARTNDHTNGKSLRMDIKWEFHKRTRQGVSAKLESYIYKVHMIYATTSCLSHFLFKAIMLYTCALTSSSRSFHYVLVLWCHIMWHVMWLRCHVPLHRHH